MIGKVNHQISEWNWIGTIPLSLTQPITKINSSIEVWTKIQTLDFPGNKPICYPLSYPVLDAIIMSCLNGCFCTNEIDNKFISNQQKSFWYIFRLEPGLFFSVVTLALHSKYKMQKEGQSVSNTVKWAAKHMSKKMLIL